MNIPYAILESRHRWLILAGLSFLAGILGAIAMLAFDWPHPLAEAWLYAALAATAALLLTAFVQWKNEIEAAIHAADAAEARRRSEPEGQAEQAG